MPHIYKTPNCETSVNWYMKKINVNAKLKQKN